MTVNNFYFLFALPYGCVGCQLRIKAQLSNARYDKNRYKDWWWSEEQYSVKYMTVVVRIAGIKKLYFMCEWHDP